MNKIEGLEVVKVQRDREHWNILQLIEPCPYCGKKHTHGACGSFDFGSGDGPRVPHCLKSAEKDYYIKEAVNTRRLEIEEKLDDFGYKYKKMPKV